MKRKYNLDFKFENKHTRICDNNNCNNQAFILCLKCRVDCYCSESCLNQTLKSHEIVCQKYVNYQQPILESGPIYKYLWGTRNTKQSIDCWNDNNKIQFEEYLIACTNQIFRKLRIYPQTTLSSEHINFIIDTMMPYYQTKQSYQNENYIIKSKHFVNVIDSMAKRLTLNLEHLLTAFTISFPMSYVSHLTRIYCEILYKSSFDDKYILLYDYNKLFSLLQECLKDRVPQVVIEIIESFVNQNECSVYIRNKRYLIPTFRVQDYPYTAKELWKFKWRRIEQKNKEEFKGKFRLELNRNIEHNNDSICMKLVDMTRSIGYSEEILDNLKEYKKEIGLNNELNDIDKHTIRFGRFYTRDIAIEWTLDDWIEYIIKMIKYININPQYFIGYIKFSRRSKLDFNVKEQSYVIEKLKKIWNSHQLIPYSNFDIAMQKIFDAFGYEGLSDILQTTTQ